MFVDACTQYYVEITTFQAAMLIDVLYYKQLSIEYSCLGFKMNFSADIENIDKIKGQFESNMVESAEIEAVFKYKDSFLNSKLVDLYHEIHDIELQLREVITFIFADTYKVDFYNLLHEVNVKPLFDDKLVKNLDKRREHLSVKLENEFFYLLFSHYIKFNDLKNLNIADLIGFLDKTENFDAYKSRIFGRGIKKKEYQDFLTSLKSNLANIEDVRNCVAHNRTPSSKNIDDYNLSIDHIRREIDDFWQVVKRTYENIIPPETYEPWEIEAWNKVDHLLSVAEWKDYEGGVTTYNYFSVGTPEEFNFKNVTELREFLQKNALETAATHFPSDKENRIEAENKFDEEALVQDVLEKYTIQLLNMGWD